MDNSDPLAIQEREVEVTDKMTSKEFLACRLIDVWCANHGGRISWKTCINITAIVTKMPDEERDRLLNME